MEQNQVNTAPFQKSTVDQAINLRIQRVVLGKKAFGKND